MLVKGGIGGRSRSARDHPFRLREKKIDSKISAEKFADIHSKGLSEPRQSIETQYVLAAFEALIPAQVAVHAFSRFGLRPPFGLTQALNVPGDPSQELRELWADFRLSCHLPSC